MRKLIQAPLAALALCGLIIGGPAAFAGETMDILSDPTQASPRTGQEEQASAMPEGTRQEREIDLFAEGKPARKTKPPRSAPGPKPDPPLATKSVAAAAPKTPFADQNEDLLPPGVDYPPFVNDNICLKSWQSEERPDKKKGNLWQIPDKWPSMPGVKDVQPCQAPPGIDYKTMSKADYLAWVSLARENMLRLSGPLSPEQSEAFNQSWAPMFAHPSPQAMEYLGKLTPMLEKFNGGQEAMARLAGDMQTVLLRANATRTMGLEAEAGDLLARVRLHKNALQQLRAGQASLAAQIKALGNPPNPFENACKNRRAFDDGLKELKKLLRKDAKGGGWVLWAYQEENKNPKTTPFPYKLPKITETMVSVDIGLPWRIEADWKRPPDRLVPGQRWSFEPHVARKGDRSMDGRWPRDLKLICTHECDRGLLRRVDSNPLMYYRGANFPEHLQFEWTADVKPVKSKVAALLVTVKVLLGLPKNCDRENDPRKNWARIKPHTCTLLKEQEAPWLLVRRYLYIHEPVGVKLKVLGGMDPAYKKQMEEREAARRKELVGVMARTTSLKQQIAAHEAFIQIYRDSLEKFKKELAREKDTKRRDELAYRLVILSSQISEEQDRIHYLKTGKELRTRTAFDEYAQQRMLAKSQEYAAKVQAVRGMADQAHALIDMLPPSERVEKRKLVYKMFDAKTLATGDIGRGKKAFMATFKQVEGLIAKDQADKELAAIDRAEAGAIRDHVKNTAIAMAGVALVGLSPALLTAYGADAALVAWAPTITGASFGGVSGFVSGGPSEGLKQAVAWSHLVGAIGVAFWDGVKGEQGSVGQGAWNASQTALIAGAVGLGVTAVGCGGKWAYQALGKKPGELVPVKGPVNSPSSHFKSNISAATEAAQRAKAQQYLADFSSSVKKLAKAQNEGASSEAVSALKAEVRNRAGLVNESWHAKHYLKYRGGGVEQKEFNEAVTMVYKGVVKGLRKRLEAMGYDTSKIKIKPIRNASSADSVGMDFDLEVSLKKGAGPLVLDGRIVSEMKLMRIAQREANILYGKATGGGCAEKAGLLITNRANAESFWELKVLQDLKKLDWSQVSDEKMPNVGEVTNFKINQATNETARSALGNVQEAVRTSHKDLPKLIGYAKDKLGGIKDPASKAKLHNVIAKLERLEAPMKRAGQSGDLAVVRQAMMEIRLQCGDKPVLEVMRDMNGLYEFLSKIKP